MLDHMKYHKWEWGIGIAVVIVMTVTFLASLSVTVPAGTKGKLMTASGFQKEIYPPSRLWKLPRTTLYLVETTTKKYNEDIKVVLKDKLTLGVNIVFRGRIDGSDAILNTIFNDMPMDDDTVTTDEVYHTYAKMIVLNTAREIISQYNVDEVNINYARMTKEIYQALTPKLKALPITISDVTIGTIAYPQIVTEAIENAKKTRMLIEKEKAEVQSRLVKTKGQEEIAKANYRIEMVKAKQIRDYNAMIKQGITPALLTLKRLEIDMKIAENLANNPNTVYMPLPMMMGGTNNMRIIK